MIVCGFRIRYFLIMGGLGLASAPWCGSCSTNTSGTGSGYS